MRIFYYWGQSILRDRSPWKKIAHFTVSLQLVLFNFNFPQIKEKFKVPKAHRDYLQLRKNYLLHLLILKFCNFTNSIIMGGKQNSVLLPPSLILYLRHSFNKVSFLWISGWQTFSVKGQRMKTLGFAKYMASDVTAHKSSHI